MTMMTKNEITALVTQLEQGLTSSHAILKDLVSDYSARGDSQNPEESFHGLHALVLILQYRLDTQDALVKLLQFDNGFLQLLGIGPHLPSKINIERMEFAIGSEDLPHILFSLGQLIHTLWRIAQRLQQSTEKETKRKRQKPSLHRKFTWASFESSLQKAILLQKQSISLLAKLCINLDEWNKLAAIAGPVLDEIAGLRGPFCQFYQAILNGLEVSHQLYQQLKQEIPLEHTLSTILQQVDAVLTKRPLMPVPHPFFPPPDVDNISEQLEQRAKNRRLGHFFRY